MQLEILFVVAALVTFSSVYCNPVNSSNTNENKAEHVNMNNEKNAVDTKNSEQLKTENTAKSEVHEKDTKKAQAQAEAEKSSKNNVKETKSNDGGYAADADTSDEEYYYNDDDVPEELLLPIFNIRINPITIAGLDAAENFRAVFGNQQPRNFPFRIIRYYFCLEHGYQVVPQIYSGTLISDNAVLQFECYFGSLDGEELETCPSNTADIEGKDQAEAEKKCEKIAKQHLTECQNGQGDHHQCDCPVPTERRRR